MVHDFYQGKLNIGRFNVGVTTLIPKVQDAMHVKQFRPICLLNDNYKLFSKILMVRLSEVADKLVDKCQTTSREIHIRWVVILHEMKKKKIKGVVFKIDFEKAYDSVNWNFLEEVLVRKGFGQQVIFWIMSIVIKDGKVCININGKKWTLLWNSMCSLQI